jgi:perosamine synthetase
VYQPDLGPRERELLLDAFDSGWISGRGPYIEQFENGIAAAAGRRRGIAVANGSVALSLVFAALGVGPGDEVVLPAYTYVACANAVRHAGATPVFADARPDDGQTDLAHALGRITTRTRMLLVPHLFGLAQDMSEVAAELERRGVWLVEDCSQALGATIGGHPVGRRAVASTHSFFGNKTITTGEGGMVVTDDDRLADLMQRLRNQGVTAGTGYDHDLLAFNFRMTNLAAAVGVAQLERLDATLARKRELADAYRVCLDGSGLRLLDDPDGGRSAQWLVTGFLPGHVDRASFIEHARARGVDVRPGFTPMYRLPMYAEDPTGFPGTEAFHASVVCLPSHPTLTQAQVARVVDAVRTGIQAAA